jgi:hypothetical protein
MLFDVERLPVFVVARMREPIEKVWRAFAKTLGTRAAEEIPFSRASDRLIRSSRGIALLYGVRLTITGSLSEVSGRNRSPRSTHPSRIGISMFFSKMIFAIADSCF